MREYHSTLLAGDRPQASSTQPSGKEALTLYLLPSTRNRGTLAQIRSKPVLNR